MRINLAYRSLLQKRPEKRRYSAKETYVFSPRVANVQGRASLVHLRQFVGFPIFPRRHGQFHCKESMYLALREETGVMELDTAAQLQAGQHVDIAKSSISYVGNTDKASPSLFSSSAKSTDP